MEPKATTRPSGSEKSSVRENSCQFDELKADGTMQALADKYGLTLAD